MTLPSDPAHREISGNFPGTVGWQLFKIGDRLPPVTFSLPFGALWLRGAILSAELRMAAKPIESIGGRGPIRVVSGCRCAFERCPPSHRQRTFSCCPARPLGAINRDAGADFEQTINDEFH
jgi:hypothetical protein